MRLFTVIGYSKLAFHKYTNGWVEVVEADNAAGARTAFRNLHGMSAVIIAVYAGVLDNKVNE